MNNNQGITPPHKITYTEGTSLDKYWVDPESPYIHIDKVEELIKQANAQGRLNAYNVILRRRFAHKPLTRHYLKTMIRSYENQTSDNTKEVRNEHWTKD